MGAHWRRRLGFAAALAAVLWVLAACGDKGNATYIEGLRVTESARSSGDQMSVDELKKGVDRYRGEVERTIKASESLGTYYRMLGVAYMNRQMYGEALQSLEQAIRLYPENEQLAYLAGVCAARASKAETDDAERTRLLSLAEKYYQRALFLFPDLRSALFGLAVVYSMELGRPADALPLLVRLLAKDTSNVEAKMLLARTHVALGNYEEALRLYDAIAAAGVSADIKLQAEANAKEIEGRIVGADK